MCRKSHVHLSKQYKNVPLCLRYCDYREQWHSLQYGRIWPAGALILIRRAPSWIQTDKGVLRGRGEAKRGDNMVANLLDHELIPRLTCEHTGNARSALLFSFGLNNNTRRSLIIFYRVAWKTLEECGYDYHMYMELVVIRSVIVKMCYFNT